LQFFLCIPCFIGPCLFSPSLFSESITICIVTTIVTSIKLVTLHWHLGPIFQGNFLRRIPAPVKRKGNDNHFVSILPVRFREIFIQAKFSTDWPMLYVVIVRPTTMATGSQRSVVSTTIVLMINARLPAFFILSKRREVFWVALWNLQVYSIKIFSIQLACRYRSNTLLSLSFTLKTNDHNWDHKVESCHYEVQNQSKVVVYRFCKIPISGFAIAISLQFYI